MLPLGEFRRKAAGLADLLNWSNLVDSGVVLCKDGMLLAGFAYAGPDIASRTEGDRNAVCERIHNPEGEVNRRVQVSNLGP